MLHTYELGIVSMQKFIKTSSLSHSLPAGEMGIVVNTFLSLIVCSRKPIMQQG